MIASRHERVEAARQIIKADPNITKRALQRELHTAFGVGLADSTRRQLLAEGNTLPVLLRKASSPCFTRREARILRKAVRQSGKAPYIREIVNDYYAFARDLYHQGWSHREIRREVLDKADLYIAEKTTRTPKNPDGTVRGQIDFWKMIRGARARAIDTGDYTPEEKKRKGGSKGDITAQKVRWRDKQSTKAHASWAERERRRIQNWLEQKDKAIAVATTPERKRELLAQRANLKRTLEAIK